MDWSWVPWRVRDEVRRLQARLRDRDTADDARHLDHARGHADLRAGLRAQDARMTTLATHLGARVDTFDHRVSQLHDLTELTLSAIRARDAWKEAFDTSAKTVGAMDAVLQQHYAHVERPEGPGWRYVLQDETGAVVSVRTARDGNAPTRIERGHGKVQSWYRLTRIEGLALIYTPEDPA